MVFMAENSLRSDYRVYNCEFFSWQKRALDFLVDTCYVWTGCAHSLEYKLSIPDFVLQLLENKIQNRKPAWV